MTPAQFRKLALALPEAEEGAHMGHPDFRVGGRVFASLQPDGLRAMAKLPPYLQAALVRDHPDLAAPAAGAWGRAGCTLLRLDGTPADLMRAALAAAWQTTAPKQVLARHRKP